MTLSPLIHLNRKNNFQDTSVKCIKKKYVIIQPQTQNKCRKHRTGFPQLDGMKSAPYATCFHDIHYCSLKSNKNKNKNIYIK